MPSFTAVAPILNQAWVDTIVTAFITAPGGALTTTVKVHLRTDLGAPTPQDTSGTYTEANYTSYAAIAVTLTGPVNLTDQLEAAIANAIFVITGAGPYTGNSVTGYYVTSATNTLIASENFPTPIGMADLGDFINLGVALPLNLYPPPAA